MSSASKTILHSFLQANLVSPNSRLLLSQNKERGILFHDKGEEFPLVDSIPIMLSSDEESAHYREHYSIDAEEFNYFQERDAATEHDEERLRQVILHRLDKTCKTLLDVGCGRAWVARELCPRGIVVCSMDISITNPRKALELYPYENHIAIVADAYALPFADASFDCLIASEIIEHVPNPARFIKELLRVVKPGGKLIVSTPYKEKLRYVLCVHCNKPTPVHAHIFSFDEKVLESLGQSDQLSFSWTSFGNKALLLLRTHVVFKFLPYALWRFVDSMANLVLDKRNHIVAEWKKST